MPLHIDDELSRQRDVLVDLGIPKLAGVTDQAFAKLVEPLREVAHQAVPDTFGAAAPGHLPFVLVTGPDLVDARALVPLTRLAGRSKPGFVDRNHGDDDLGRYLPIAPIELPGSPLYLITDVERGDEFRAVRPEDALPTIIERGRTPLTIHEGIAVLTQFPEVLAGNHCFMLSGSRRGDRRVPALWISAGAPKLGWCWDGNPHDWLGVASTADRLGPAEPAAPAQPVVHAANRG